MVRPWKPLVFAFARHHSAGVQTGADYTRQDSFRGSFPHSCDGAANVTLLKTQISYAFTDFPI